ncbi:MAG TPA: hypothetical protein EYP23_01100 [Thermoplasmata archaeon]|nr:hypothetical protein [Thermoplasmata archaeon]
MAASTLVPVPEYIVIYHIPLIDFGIIGVDNLNNCTIILSMNDTMRWLDCTVTTTSHCPAERIPT